MERCIASESKAAFQRNLMNFIKLENHSSPVDYMEDRNPHELIFSEASTELQLSFTASEIAIQL